MTVAAIVLAPDAAGALGDADGEPAIRRVAHAAWSGGALPVVIVAPDTAGEIAAAVAGLPVMIVDPGAEPRGIAWFVAGQRAAHAAVAETTAGLLWPFRHAWVDPETITSLVEAHGTASEQIIRPVYAGRPGMPVLIPTGHTDRLAARPDLHGNDAVAWLVAEGAATGELELGDPGIVHDMGTPRSELPEYQAPPRSVAGPPPDWNADLAAHADRSGEAELPTPH